MAIKTASKFKYFSCGIEYPLKEDLSLWYPYLKFKTPLYLIQIG